MKQRLFLEKNGATVSFNRSFPSGLYIVELRDPSGELMDRVRCDDYRNACQYRRAFSAIARNQ